MTDNKNIVHGPEGKTTEIFIIVSVFLILIFIGTAAYHFIEGWTYIDSFYFAVSTLTTVGYGDIVPSTNGSKIFTAFYVLVGVSMFFYGLFSIGEHFVKIRITEIEQIMQAQGRAAGQTQKKVKTRDEILKEILKEYYEGYDKR
ncbi:hypothetical protein BEH94_04265 [Candidatus Altiarchaeales archaeon WOR_SM1_SCG]|nr:hypothetical protein BEH94_04265 [Candidatus Altiarchaeales archaeon WOR_SM1_SCG]